MLRQYVIFTCMLSLIASIGAQDDFAKSQVAVTSWTMRSRIVATDLPRAWGVRQVGRFHSGGPFAADPEFLVETQPGRVLDPERVLVAVQSNLGAPRANAAHAPGAVLSIDTREAGGRAPMKIPIDLALHAEQARKPGASVQIYTVQSEPYLNRRHNGQARTAEFTSASGPRYLSINNAFGRPWIANAPFGLSGDGSESVVDPDGTPLDSAPSNAAGGVFVGNATPRENMTKGVRSGWLASDLNYRPSPQMTAGSISHGALGTAFLGPSPDGSGFAVFAVITGDGAVAQIHVQDGVDGLAPPGTIVVGASDPGVIGVSFKWAPERVLYIADAQRNRITLLHLNDDTRHFKLKRISYIDSASLQTPVDLAAAIPEIANPRFASHTTLSGGSDLYVANRGDGSLLRVSQEGKVLARAEIVIPGQGRIGGGRLRSMAVSADAQKLWLIVEQVAEPHGTNNMLLEVSAFDENGPFTQLFPSSSRVPNRTIQMRAGEKIFRTAFTAHNGLGQQFNANSCVACHPGPGGSSPSEEHFARRLARMDPVSGRMTLLAGRASLLAPRFSLPIIGKRGTPITTLNRQTNVISMRMPLSLFAVGKIDDIPDAVIEAQAISKGDGIKGRVHYIAEPGTGQRVGRYGWKADVATLDDMVARAFLNEMGISSALGQRAQPLALEDDGTMVRSISAYLRALPRPEAAR